MLLRLHTHATTSLPPLSSPLSCNRVLSPKKLHYYTQLLSKSRYSHISRISNRAPRKFTPGAQPVRRRHYIKQSNLSHAARRTSIEDSSLAAAAAVALRPSSVHDTLNSWKSHLLLGASYISHTACTRFLPQSCTKSNSISPPPSPSFRTSPYIRVL